MAESVAEEQAYLSEMEQYHEKREEELNDAVMKLKAKPEEDK